jgi:alpha-tubulin suppressor-like RCC1 family protein
MQAKSRLAALTVLGALIVLFVCLVVWSRCGGDRDSAGVAPRAESSVEEPGVPERGAIVRPPDGTAHKEAAPGRDEVEPAVEQPPVRLSRTAAGSIWACGANTWGQLGTGDTMGRKVPCLVRGLGGVVQVAAGRNISLALRGDGTVWSWGAYCSPDDDGELVTSHVPVAVEGLLDVAAIAVYDLRCFALLGSGEVHEWRAGGDSIVHTRAGRPERPMGMRLAGSVEGVRAGAFERNGGILRRWVEPRLRRWQDRGGERPVLPEGRPRKADAPGWEFCLVLDGEGAVWGRGENRFGQLGTGSKSPREEGTARMVAPGTVVSVAAGSRHSLIVTGDETPNTAPLAEDTRIPGVAGKAVPLRPRAIDREGCRLDVRIVTKPLHGSVAWRGGEFAYVADAGFAGEDRFSYRVSDGELPSETAEILVDILPNVPRGRLIGWGKNRHGQVGNGTFENQRLPVPVSGLRGVVQADAGHDHAVALLEDGSVWCWGRNDNGQLGDGTYEDRSRPTKVRGLRKAKAVAAGSYFTVAVLEDGTVRTWGWNSSGMLGDGSTVDSNRPVAAKGLAGVVAVTAGHHGLALAADGTVWAWGSNSHSAMVGDGRERSSTRPVRLEALSDVTAIAAGEAANLVLRKDGSVWAWGRSARVQAGPLPARVEGIDNVVAISAGYWHGLVMTADGNLWSWGLNGSGQLGDGSREPSRTPVPVGPVPNVKVIAAGGWNSFVIWDGPAPLDTIDTRGNDTF